MIAINSEYSKLKLPALEQINFFVNKFLKVMTKCKLG